MRVPRLFQVTSAYVGASGYALLLCCALDLLRAGELGSAPALFVLALTCLLCGSVCGLVLHVLVVLGSRVHSIVQLSFWLLLALFCGTFVGDSLGAFARLDGRYRLVAHLTLLTSYGCALVLALLPLGMNPARPAVPAGWWLRRSARGRRAVSLVLAAGALGVFWIDGAYYVGLYPQAHRALRACAWWLSTFALVLWPHAATWLAPRLLTTLGIIALALGAGTLSPLASSYASAPFSTRGWPRFVLVVARVLSDFDFDGYSALFGGGDCQPWNAEAHPGAPEIPDNGIDDNCSLGDAKRRTLVLEWPPVPSGASPLDVVLITCDALRPDHLGVYDARYGRSGRATSPALDAFAESAVVFERAYSPGGGTSVALGSMLRGLYARRLHWTVFYETDRYRLLRDPVLLAPGEQVASVFPLAYEDPRMPLPELLLRRRMFTIAALDDGYSDMLKRETGVARGFSRFLATDELPLNERDDAGTANQVITALRDVPAGKRFFLWAHFFGTHNPNTKHPGAREYGDSLADGYDHEINYLDMQLARVFEALAQRALPVAVIISADHGDVMSNGRYHGYTLTDDVVRIPLIARVPGWRPARVAAPVNLVDVFPTVLELTHTPAPSQIDGRPLSRFLRGRVAPPQRVLFSDSWLYTASGKSRVDLSAAYDASGKLRLDRYSEVRTREYPPPPDQAASSYERLSKELDSYLEETGGALFYTD